MGLPGEIWEGLPGEVAGDWIPWDREAAGDLAPLSVCPLGVLISMSMPVIEAGVTLSKGIC